MPETDARRRRRERREVAFQQLGEAQSEVTERHKDAWYAPSAERAAALVAVRNAVAAYKTALDKARAAVREEERG